MKSLALLSLVSTALALGSNHEAIKRHHKMKRMPTSLKTRSDVVVAYYGYQNNTEGACGWISKDTDYIVGLSTDYVTSTNTQYCGQQVVVTLADDTSSSVTVTVTDACDKCPLYLSAAAFKDLVGSLDPGEVNVTWAFSDSTSSGSTSASTSSSAAAKDDAVSTSSTKHAASTPTSSSVSVSSTSSSISKDDDAPSTSSSASSSTSTVSTGGTSSDGWTNTNYLTGSSIFDFFTFDTDAAANSGYANYVGRDSGLAYTDGNGNAVIAIDSTETVSDLRDSIFMISNTDFNVGSLFIVDVAEIPAVCGAWPAIWLTGGCTWPDCGEIDIVEGVNLYTQNIASVHTSDGCYLSSSDVSSLTAATLKDTSTYNCDANADSEACGFNFDSTTSYGKPFNSAGGGTYAVSFTSDAIEFFFWQEGDVPSDVTNNSPTPSAWGDAIVKISNDACDISSYFTNMYLIINTNLGGTFAEGVWSTTGNGQSTSCADSTGYSSAYEYVTQVGSAFADAKFVIRSIATYSQ